MGVRWECNDRVINIAERARETGRAMRRVKKGVGDVDVARVDRGVASVDDALVQVIIHLIFYINSLECRHPSK